MNQKLMILLISLNEATGDNRHDLCQSGNIHILKCKCVKCINCPLQTMPRGYTVDLTNTARELAYEPRTNSNTQFPVQAR